MPPLPDSAYLGPTSTPPAAAAPPAKQSPAVVVRALMQGLHSDNAEQAAGVVAALDLAAASDADAVAAEMYSAACGSPEKADAVAALLAAMVASDRNGNARPLRRHLLTRCEKAFDLTPPPGMGKAWQSKMAAVAFVAALFRAGVIPSAIMTSCLDELLGQSNGGSGKSHAAPDVHDLECAHLMLEGAGRKLDLEGGQEGRAAVERYMRRLDGLLARGALKSQPTLAAALRSLVQLRAAGWELPPPQRHDFASAAAESAAAADAAAEAFASQLSLGSSGSASGGSGPVPAAEASMPVPPQAPPQAAPQPLSAPPSLSAQPLTAQPLPDSWDYLAPDGSGVFGPFGMEQLVFWVQQGHMAPDTQVRPHSSEGPWLSLPAARHSMAAGAPPPAAAPLPLVPGGGPVPGSAPANIRGGLGAWAGHATPVQQLAAYQQESWPALAPNGSAPNGSSASPPPGFGGTAARPAPARAPYRPPLQVQAAVPPAPVQPAQPAPQPQPQPQSSVPWSVPAPAAHLPQPQPGTPWAVPAPAPQLPPAPRPPGTAPVAVPAARRVQEGPAAAGAAGRGGYGSPSGSAGSSPAFGMAHSSSGRLGGGRKQKGVGYSDDKDWLVKNGRGKVSGPFTGYELLDMLHHDTLAEDSQIKKNDWKAYKPLEEVEGVILEMFSSKPGGASKPQPPGQGASAGRRRSDQENAQRAGPVSAFGASGGLGQQQEQQSDGWPAGGAGMGGLPGYGAPPAMQLPGTQLYMVHPDPDAAQAYAAGFAAAQGFGAGAFGAPPPEPPFAPQGALPLPGAFHPAAPQLPPSPAGPWAPPAAPLPGTPGGPAQHAPWLGAPELAAGTPGTPAMGTPAAGFGPDGPAGATPPSVRYTPGLPAMDAGLLGGFTPSPAPFDNGGFGGGYAGSQASPAPSPWQSGPAPAWAATSPAPAAGPAAAAPAAGGPQVPAPGAHKPAFAAWSAAAADQAASASASSSSRPSAAISRAASDRGARNDRRAALRYACLQCSEQESVYVWVPCGHKFCAGCVGDAKAACCVCGASSSCVRMW